MPLPEIIQAQLDWAASKWPGHSAPRAPSLADNLICPMSDSIHAQFEQGSGGELGLDGKPGKMSSLRSSSALGYNFFAPWSGRNLSPLAAALRTTARTSLVHFEQKFPHGLGSMPPNLDVVLDLDEPSPLGIECKFTEPYGPKQEHAALAEKYFVGDRLRWTELGMPRCQTLAREIGRSIQFKRLSADQLLKHLLGLAHTTKHSPRLRYVWFDSGCSEAEEHREEVQRFAQHIGDEIDFAALTYQAVFASLQGDSEPMPGYFSYLGDRYFSKRHASPP
jgi:hypothetical protein